METRRWLNQSQPQTLQSATIFLYLNAALGVLTGGVGGPGIFRLIGLATIAGAAAGYGIANERKWGYLLACVVAVIPLAFSVLAVLNIFNVLLNFQLVLNIIFEILLVVLVFHPMSRHYQKIWFK